MNRNKTLAALVLLAVVTVPVVSAASTANVTISSVDVSPKESVPGADVSIQVTIENFESSDAGYFIDRLWVVENKQNDPETFTQVKDIGTVPVGTSKLVPLSTSFEYPGTYNLLVRVSGRDANTDQRTQLRYPVTITVRDRQPQLDLDANDSVAGVRSDGSITVANSLSNPIEDVELTVEGEEVTITNRRSVLATLASNASRTVDFQYRADEPGNHDLTATLTYTTAGGVTDTVTDTLTVRTDTERPQLDLDTNTSIAGLESSGTVTVANGLGSAVTNAELTVSGDGISVRNDRTVITRIADGDTATAQFEFEPDSAGEHDLTATLTYSTPGGATQTVEETFTVEADPLRDSVALDLSSRKGGNSQAVRVTVLNQGNAPITNVSVRGTSANATVGQVLVSRVAPGESRAVRLNATLNGDSAPVDVTATYDVAGQRGEASASTLLTQTPGTISLTGIDVVPEGGTLRISGSASNLGTTDAQSVLVSVVDTEQVTPVSEEYFVGTVPASDFVSFDVSASVRGNVSTVPLRVQYLVDGTRHTRTVEVDAAGASRALAAENEPQTGSGGGGGGFLLPAAIAGIVALAVVAVIVRAWRNSRGGD